jgi:hypothetical protein
MRSSEQLVSTGHLARKAVIYVRQSTPHQVLTNQESLKLQYALKKRATELGWHADDIEVIDSDLGLTGSEASHREGFKELSARVTLGQVGIVLSSEVTRLSRNCSDWYPLLDICGYKGCLIHHVVIGLEILHVRADLQHSSERFVADDQKVVSLRGFAVFCGVDFRICAVHTNA